MKPLFRDGLWRVDSGSFCAGFVVSKGHLTQIAPVLRKNFDVFKVWAVWVCP